MAAPDEVTESMKARQRQQPQKAEEQDSVVHDEDAEEFASAFEDFFSELTPADNNTTVSAEESKKQVKGKASSQKAPGKAAKSSKKRKAAATTPSRSRSKSMRKRSTSK